MDVDRHEERARRVASNESVFRDVNERIEESAQRFGISARATFLCECGDPSCTDPIELTVSEYEHVRAEPARFALRAGHEDLEVERVVETHEAYLVVEKLEGPGYDEAASRDPRGYLGDSPSQ